MVMAISLYDLSVPTYLQTIGAASHFLERGLKHLRESGVDPEEIVETRLFPDMLPFRFQVQSIIHHSVHALEAVKLGAFEAARAKDHADYAALQAQLQEAQETLRKLTPEEINAREGAEVHFEVAGNKLPFTAENFVLSFSLPNFHFHATTAYDILRSKGVPLGKRDYMGRVRMKR
jgi:hypothetical protein